MQKPGKTDDLNRVKFAQIQGDFVAWQEALLQKKSALNQHGCELIITGAIYSAKRFTERLNLWQICL
ncbi:hypothetical protein [Paenibacillus jiagnxiensis]|uniref:hypothetical protein n=1 Tax=Paenibacillus jiagnxiensis TaxID=3228926 RepID=UPI0033A50479